MLSSLHLGLDPAVLQRGPVVGGSYIDMIKCRAEGKVQLSQKALSCERSTLAPPAGPRHVVVGSQIRYQIRGHNTHGVNYGFGH